jgi:hypothetical protein
MSRVAAVWIALPLLLTPSAFADMKAKSRMTIAGRAMESSDFVKGARKRSEMQIMPGFNTISIYQCDLKRMVTLNERNKTYMITELGDADATPAPEPAPANTKAKSTPPPKGPGGVITLTMNSTDTGETKQMFGHTARHVKTEMSSDASPGSSCGANMKMETDGWYIDFQGQQLNCTVNPRAAAPRGDGGGASCNDKIRIKHSGNAKLGYPVSTTMTMSGPNGQPYTMKQETLELSNATLDPALFEIPPGYREVKNYSELMGMNGIGGMISAGKAAAAAASAEAANAGATSTSASSPKAAGKLRIGVLRFKNSANATVADTTFRDRLVSEIQQLEFEAVPLEVAASAQRSEIEQAAREAQCDYYVISDISKVKDESSSAAGKKAFGGFLSHVTGTDASSATGSNNGGYALTVDYKLYATGDKDAHLETNSTSNAGANADSSAAPVLEEEALNVGVQVKRDAELRRRTGGK